jgi:hypothetical protein
MRNGICFSFVSTYSPVVVVFLFGGGGRGCLAFFVLLVFSLCLAPDVANVVELSIDDCPFGFL